MTQRGRSWDEPSERRTRRGDCGAWAPSPNLGFLLTCASIPCPRPLAGELMTIHVHPGQVRMCSSLIVIAKDATQHTVYEVGQRPNFKSFSIVLAVFFACFRIFFLAR